MNFSLLKVSYSRARLTVIIPILRGFQSLPTQPASIAYCNQVNAIRIQADITCIMARSALILSLSECHNEVLKNEPLAKPNVFFDSTKIFFQEKCSSSQLSTGIRKAINSIHKLASGPRIKSEEVVACKHKVMSLYSFNKKPT